MQRFRIRVFILFLFCCFSSIGYAQINLKSLDELTCPGNKRWEHVTMLSNHAKNKVEILARDSARSCRALVQSQLSTNTLLGSVIYNTGGILIDDGWIRILGSGSQRLNRSVPEWNAGKLYAMRNEETFYLLVADDVLGGLFAVKAASIEEIENIGQVFYYGPNSLTWQPTGLSYSSFLSFCFAGNIKDFYDDFRWKGWQDEIKTIDCNSVISCYPMLWTREGLQMKANRKLLAIQTQWNMYQGKAKATGKQKTSAQRQPPRPQPASLESMWSMSTTSR